ncbi:MAG TPA: tape measure protein [Candidatus Mailhella merdavium]|nr:tape measure protein [Candidatus Mailhella merdavium]
MASAELSLQITVDGAQKAVADLAAVDAGLKSGTASAAAFGKAGESVSLSHIARIRDTFKDAGIEINSASKSVQDLVSRMQRLERERAFQQLARDADLSAVHVSRLRASMGDTSGAARTLASAVLPGKLGLAALGAAALYAAKACLDAQIAMQRMEQSYEAVFGAGAAEQLQVIYAQADRVGLKFVETAEAAKSFFAAGQGTSLAGDLNAIFNAVTDAGAALQLSTDDINGTFIALGQMMSKGKVQAEELRGQLGERLPGAFQMAAQAMGMTTAELDKFMAEGKLTAEDLLPKLAAALEDRYGAAAEDAADTVQGSLNRAATEWERFKAGLVNSDAAVFTIDIVTRILKTVNDAEAEETRRTELDAQLEAMGAPEQRRIFVGKGMGFTDRYTNEQRARLERQQFWDAQNNWLAEKALAEEEAAIEKGRAALDSAWKKTSQGRLQSINDEKTAELAKIDTLIEAYRRQGVSVDTELTRRAAVESFYDQQIADAQKKSGASVISAAAGYDAYAGAIASAEAELIRLQYQLALDPGEKLALERTSAEAEYRKALAASNAEIDRRVARGEYSAEEGERLKALQSQSLEMERQLALRNAEQSAHEENVALVEGQLDFYKELASLSGDYSASMELQNRLVGEQARRYRELLNIPQELVAEWEKLARLQASVDPFDGAYRGLLKFTAEYADEASQWESISYGFASDFESATRDMFDEFLSTGRMSFDSLADAFAATLKNMAYQALVQPVVVSVVQSAAGALYGSTSADGGAGAGSAAGGGLVQSTAGALQNYAAGQVFKGGTSFLPESISSGISGILSTPLPGTTIPGLMGPTASGAALGGGLTISSALGYGGFGSLGYGLLGGALGLPQNQYTGITSGLGGALGAWGASAALGGTALGASLGSVVPVVGTAIGALVGGLLGGLFGKKRKPRWGTDYSVNLWESATAAGQEQEYMAPDGKVRWKTAAGLSVASAAKNGAPDELENIGVDAVYDLLHAMQVQSGKIADMLGGVNAGMETAYLEALKAGGAFAGSRWLKGGDITEENFRKYLEDIQAEAMGRMASAMATIDLRPLTVAADGMAADTVDELSGALKSAFDYHDFGAQLFTDDALTEFQAGAREQIEKAFADLDMSSLRVDFDQSSFAGLQQAYAAMQAWEQVTEGLESILNPASELEAAMSAATVQFDSWIDSLRSLGWQEEAIAEIEAKRAQYLNEYAMAAMRATEQDLNLRAMALQYGSNSDAYGLQSLQYQQQNELEELARKFGKDSGIYQSAVEIQQAELAQYRVEQLQAELETALAAQQQAAQQETQNRINALNSQAAALRESVSEAERMRDALEDIAEALGDARRDLWASDEDNPLGTSYQEALAAFEDAYLKGVAGDQDALNELPALASDLLMQGRGSLATAQEYTDLFYDVDRKLEDAQKYATEQYDAQTAIADGLAAQLEAITGQTDALQSAINAGTAAGEYTGRSVDAIRAELELMQALLEREKEDIAGGATLSAREALIQAKVNQLNAQAYEGRTDWTAESFLAAMYGDSMTLESWYDKFGRYEGLGVTYDTDAARMAILENKADLMNAGQTADGWTAEKVLDAISGGGMTVDDWYLRYGLSEGVTSPGATSATGGVSDIWTQLLSDKAVRLNQEHYKGRNDWTAASVLEAIANDGMTVQEWYEQFGRQEGFVLRAAGTTNDVIDSRMDNVDKGIDRQVSVTGALSGTMDSVGDYLGTVMNGLGSSVTSYMGSVQSGLGGLSSAISGLDWTVTVNVSAGGESGSSITTSSGTATGSPLPPGGDDGTGYIDPLAPVPGGTGIYGSRYRTEYALLYAKLQSLRNSNTTKPPDGYDSWTMAALQQAIADSGYNTASWYEAFGRNEGFATGGITPVNEPFWVGENGPELMMSPKQWGILSNQDSVALMDKIHPSGPAWEGWSGMSVLIGELREIRGYLRQALIGTGKNTTELTKMRRLLNKWDDTGLPPLREELDDVYLPSFARA